MHVPHFGVCFGLEKGSEKGTQYQKASVCVCAYMYVRMYVHVCIYAYCVGTWTPVVPKAPKQNP